MPECDTLASPQQTTSALDLSASEAAILVHMCRFTSTCAYYAYYYMEDTYIVAEGLIAEGPY